MEQLKIYHHRDHNNGGKFDGNCAVDTGRAFGTYYTNGVRCRFRIEEIDSGLGTIWGVGDPSNNDQYALKFVESSGEYYLRVRWLDVDYNFTSFKITGDDIYEVHVKKVLSLTLNITIFDRYHKELYYESKSNTSNEGSYSMSTDNVYLGGSNDGEGIIEGFHGYIFDWDAMYTGTSDYSRYVFYEDWNSVGSNKVADFLGNYDGNIIGTQPSDFWPIRVDISKPFKKGSSAIIKYRQDKFRSEIGLSLRISLFNYADIKRHDTIEIQIDDDVTNDKASNILNVTEIKNRVYARTDIICEDIFGSLRYVSLNYFAQKPYAYWAIDGDKFWWSTYVSVGASDFYYDATVKRNRYITMNYILEFIRGLLQYDNLFEYDKTTFLGTDSDYWQMENDVVIKYQYFAYHLGMLSQMGISDSTEERTQKMYSVFRDTMRALRFVYYFKDGKLLLIKLANGNTSFTKYFDEDTEKVRNYKFYQIVANIIQDLTYGYPDYDAYYAAFTSSDIDELIANNIDDGFKLSEKELIISITLTKHFWIHRKSTTGTNLRQLSYNGGKTFIDQYADILDAELRGLKEFEEIEVRLTEDNSANFYYKEDDLIKRISKIKQEIVS